MPLYKYEALDVRGRSRSGMMPAQDESNLELKLREAGLWLTEADVHWPKVPADSPKAAIRRFTLRGSHGRRELIDFCALISFQVQSGITAVKALEVAAEDCKSAGFRRVLENLKRQIEGGLKFHEAMSFFPRVFSVHFLTVVKAGEATGTLPEAFNNLKEYLEWVDRVLADVRQATLYPAIVVTVITTFVVFLFTFIVPKFAALLNGLHVKQPFLTRIVFSLGDFASATWWLWLPLIFITVVFLLVGKRLSPRIRLMLDRLGLRLPIFGELNLMLAISRFAHNFSILYRSGIPIIQALDLCQQGLIGNSAVNKAVAAVEEDVKTGSTLSEAMHRQPVFPALLKRMVGMGESSGSLDKALDNVSAYYSEVIPRRIKRVFSILEPMLMLFLIFLVGLVALAIYLPIISLMGAIPR
jgi:type II secretory pathway component PulF